MHKKNIFDYDTKELGAELENAGFQKFRAKQIFHWLYVRYIDDFYAMDNLPLALKEYLSANYTTANTTIHTKESSNDGTVKYLFKTKDNLTYEAVFLKMKEDRFTLCLSSQIGCKVGCSFCLTAKNGFSRNLTAGEMVYQVFAIKKDQNLSNNKAINIVYMGMGEPLDNLNNLTKCIAILSDLDGLSISVRRQTVSTSGIAPKIKKLGTLNLGIQLAISLHAVSNELRNELMPINKAYNIQAIIDEIAHFPIDKRKRVMFEYLVIDGLNDGLESAKKLVALLNKIKAKVNLIYFNPHEGSIYRRPSKEKVEAFREFLLKKGLLCTIRESKGLDISAACGQLRERNLNPS